MTSSQRDAMRVSSSLNYEARIERLGALSSRPSRPARPSADTRGDIVGDYTYDASHRRPRWLLLQRLLRETSGSAIEEGERRGDCRFAYGPAFAPLPAPSR